MVNKDFTILLKLKKAIRTLDRLCFEKTIPVLIVNRKPIHAIADYFPEWKGHKEHYEIAKITDKEMREEILLRRKGLALKPFMQDAIIWGMASHEVRHRVQWYFPMISFYEVVFEENFPIKEIQDKDLKASISFTIDLYEKLMLKDKEFRLSKLKKEFEFDAEVIANYVARKFKNTSIKNIAEIIKADAKKLIGVGKSTPFLLLNRFYICGVCLPSIVDLYCFHAQISMVRSQEPYDSERVILKFSWKA